MGEGDQPSAPMLPPQGYPTPTAPNIATAPPAGYPTPAAPGHGSMHPAAGTFPFAGTVPPTVPPAGYPSPAPQPTGATPSSTPPTAGTFPFAGTVPPTAPPAGYPSPVPQATGATPSSTPPTAGTFPVAGTVPPTAPPVGYPAPQGQAGGYPASQGQAGGQVQGVPPVTVTGDTNFVFDASAPLYYPPSADEPVFLGATRGHGPINLHCGKCGYQGPSKVKRKKGWGSVMVGAMTLGVGALLPIAEDTHHHCPNCKTHVAVAKLF